jgi:nitroreductase
MIAKQDILAAFNYRHACKEFDPARKIDPADFEFILETARLSPSSFGHEPWQIVVIQDMALREKLLPVTWGAQKTLPTASHYIAILARKTGLLPEDAHVQHIMHDIQKLPPERIEMRSKVYRNFLESDFKLLGYERGVFDWACRQAYIALGNMMSAAAMIGIDSCPVEGFDQEKTEAVLSQAGALDARQFGLAVMLAFGYRKNPQPAKTRRPMAEVVQWVK